MRVMKLAKNIPIKCRKRILLLIPQFSAKLIQLLYLAIHFVLFIVAMAFQSVLSSKYK